jgi:hypothetical protein
MRDEITPIVLSCRIGWNLLRNWRDSITSPCRSHFKAGSDRPWRTGASGHTRWASNLHKIQSPQCSASLLNLAEHCAEVKEALLRGGVLY